MKKTIRFIFRIAGVVGWVLIACDLFRGTPGGFEKFSGGLASLCVSGVLLLRWKDGIE